MNKPNVVLFFVDDQRFDTIQALGNKEIKTPNLDEFLKDSTTFTNAHIPGGTSGAVCMPSRAMLNTGKTLFNLLDSGSEIPKEHKTIGEFFREIGYDSFGTGKWHNGKESYARSFTHGGKIFFGGMADHWNVPTFDFDPTGKYEGKVKYTVNPFASSEINSCDYLNSSHHSTETIVKETMDFIQSRGKNDKPFFAYTALLAPHDPRTMPKEFLDMYGEIELPKNFMESYPIDYGAQCERDEHLAKFPRNPKEIKYHLREYYAMITHIDHEFGKLIKLLKDRGEYENTVVIFTGDNGLAIGQHGYMGKQNLYEHSLRVPLIVSGPGIQKGITDDNLVYLLDIFPTLCEYLGYEIPKTVDGKSFFRNLKGENVTFREYLYLAFTSKIRGVKNREYKYIEYHFDGKVERELFNLTVDPLELKNLVNEGNSKEIIEKFYGKLLEFRKEWNEDENNFGKLYWEDLK